MIDLRTKRTRVRVFRRGERKRVFEPFYRISDNLTDGVAGAGIGLAVSRTLAEKLGGSLTLEKDGPRAVFKLEVPNDTTGGAG